MLLFIINQKSAFQANQGFTCRFSLSGFGLEEEATSLKKNTQNHTKEGLRDRLKRQRTESCSQSLSWLEDQGLIPVTVTVRNVSTGKEEAIHLCDQDLFELFGQSEDVDKDILDTVNMMLYIKDWYNISDCAYHELAKVCKEMP